MNAELRHAHQFGNVVRLPVGEEVDPRQHRALHAVMDELGQLAAFLHRIDRLPPRLMHRRLVRVIEPVHPELVRRAIGIWERRRRGHPCSESPPIALRAALVAFHRMTGKVGPRLQSGNRNGNAQSRPQPAAVDKCAQRHAAGQPYTERLQMIPERRRVAGLWSGEVAAVAVAGGSCELEHS
ncbi:MAG: hypothetical protein JNK78_03370 [Planctomycetes bacterium]|nr:hypothetical protein [Planctomycetota bacterium]